MLFQVPLSVPHFVSFASPSSVYDDPSVIYLVLNNYITMMEILQFLDIVLLCWWHVIISNPYYFSSTFIIIWSTYYHLSILVLHDYVYICTTCSSIIPSVIHKTSTNPWVISKMCMIWKTNLFRGVGFASIEMFSWLQNYKFRR